MGITSMTTNSIHPDRPHGGPRTDYRDLACEHYAEVVVELVDRVEDITAERDIYQAMVRETLCQLHRMTARLEAARSTIRGMRFARRCEARRCQALSGTSPHEREPSFSWPPLKRVGPSFGSMTTGVCAATSRLAVSTSMSTRKDCACCATRSDNCSASADCAT
jgi:hypothetical protein